jgi:hypothetical protein
MRGRQFFVGTAIVLAAGTAVAQSRDAGMISQQLPPDAASIGMGAAYTALAEGVAAAYWNPAGLALGAESPSVWLRPVAFLRLLPDFSDHIYLYTGGGAFHARSFGFGFNVNRIHYGDQVDADGRGGSNTEQTVQVGGGLDVARAFFPGMLGIPVTPSTALDVHVALGANIKLFTGTFGAALLRPSSGSAHDFDLSSLVVARFHAARPTDGDWQARVRAGVVLSNVLDHEIAFGDLERDPLGRSVRAGLAAEAASSSLPGLGPMLAARTSLDLQSYFGRVRDRPVYSYGFELEALGILAIRAGHDGHPRDTAIGFGIATPPGRRFRLRIDAANLPVSDDGIGGPHTQYELSGCYAFGWERDRR